MNRPFPLRIAALWLARLPVATRPLRLLGGAAFVLSFSACKKPEIRVYTISKDLPEAAVPQAAPPVRLSDAEAMPSAKAPRTRPQLDYQLPAGWQDVGPSEFSLINFRIKTASGDAMVNITPLAGMSGRDTVIVNMWRQQVGEPPLEEAAAAESLTPVDIGGEPGKLFAVTGTQNGQKLEIVTAFVHRSDGSWFYKLQGDEEAVASQKTAFVDFLKTVKIKPASAATAETNPATAAPAPAPAPAVEPEPPVRVMAPEGWKEQPPGQMQVAKFAVEKDGAKADVSVSVFGSDTGGTLGNVNRWRRQIGLGDIDESGLTECVTTLGGAHFDGAPGPVLVDLSKENRRLLGAIVPREGKWWFYKMVGDATAVNAEHDTFVQFVKSQP